MATAIPEDDVRHDLAAEVGTRLGQLDLILNHLRIALDVVIPDRQEWERVNSWSRDNYPALKRGEISIEQWIGGTILPCQVERQDYFEAWESINLFTESFYFVAWRLREVLNIKDDGNRFRLPGLGKIKAEGIRDIRNQLLQHPEKDYKNSDKCRRRFTQGLAVTDYGPVLRTTETAIKFATGETIPTGSSVDKEGLYVTSEKFRDELQTRFNRAIKSLTSA
ncbi:MAG: hypothetical protein DLM55_12245 [Acidimicrobiales bacterium]|nr:MAG: hypothetical protein DLM55_12245 [Acidimicrobiales bacterium]